jgi:hypothetical protein
MLQILGYTVSTLTESSSGPYKNFEISYKSGYSCQTGSRVVHSIVLDIKMLRDKRIK